MQFMVDMVKLGLGNLRRHKMRAVLTALGIILGVAAVITSSSVSEGKTRQALSQIERLGARNIIVRSQKPPESQQAQGGQGRSWVSKYGLTREDVRIIEENFPDAEGIVPLKAVGGQILKGDRRKTSQAFGTTPEFATVANVRVARGRYLTQGDMEERAPVAVIGAEVAKEMFPFEDPLGSTLQIDAKIVTVVGVLAPVGLSAGAGAGLVGRDLNLDVQIPLSTARAIFGDLIMRRESGSFQNSEVQVSELYLVAPSRDEVLRYAELLKRILDVRHPGLKDLGVIVPYELLESARREALTGKVVGAVIAGIALLVGGIGIMNIMLASVTERTREIGIRRALGATRRHIIWQFLIETGVLSTLGGIIGVGLGLGLSALFEFVVPRLPALPLVGGFFNANVSMPTQVTAWSVGVSFVVAALTGLLFGIYPAMKAASQDPIVALRHD
ncbi:MAG TPA: ABC transporter permease [Phycisphaerales bacterium]|nr:ABC transporter permease [Phycisphaerales bacterium]